MNDRMLTDLYAAAEAIEEAIADTEIPGWLTDMLVTANDNLRGVLNNLDEEYQS